MTILIPQLLSLICRKQAQSPKTSGQVTNAGRGRVRTQGNFGLQDPLSLNKPAWEWLTGWSLYLPICHAPFHFMSRPLVPSLVHLAALKEFLNVESLISFCMQFDVLAYAYSLWNHLPSLEWIYLSPPKVSSCPFEIASSWPLPGNPLLQADTSLFSVTVE